MTHLPGDLGSLIRPHRIRISGAIQQERRPIGDSRPELGRQGPELVREPGSAQLDRGVRDDLRKARIKTATGHLTRALSPVCELGKACTDAKGVFPMMCKLADPP